MDNNNDLFNNCLKYKKIKFDINILNLYYKAEFII